MVAIKYFVFVFLTVSLVGCMPTSGIPKKYVSNTPTFDESTINTNDNFNCDIETLIRDEFPKYRIHKESDTEIYFYDFKNLIQTNGNREFYLMELFYIDYSNPTQLKSSVKYFKSLHKRINRIQTTEHSGNGLASLINHLKNCNNGG